MCSSDLQLRDLPRGLDQYFELRNLSSLDGSESVTATIAQPKVDRRELKKSIERVEKSLSRREEQLHKLEQELVEVATDYARLAQIHSEIEQLKIEKENLEQEWLTLLAELELLDKK